MSKNKIIISVSCLSHYFPYYKSVLFVQAKNIYAFEPYKGKLQWQIHSKSEEGFCRGAPIITNDNLYAVEQNGRLISAGLNDGAVIKEFDFKETVRSPLIMTNDLIYLAPTQKRIYAVNIKEIKKILEFSSYFFIVAIYS